MTNTPKPKRQRLSTPQDNALRASKQVAELARRRAAARDAYETKRREYLDREQKLIAALTDEEREILFRLDPSLRPSPPVAVSREN